MPATECQKYSDIADILWGDGARHYHDDVGPFADFHQFGIAFLALTIANPGLSVSNFQYPGSELIQLAFSKG